MANLERVSELQSKIETIMERLAHLNVLCGNIFDKTLIKQEEIDFASTLPSYDLFRKYRIELTDTMALLEQELHEDTPSMYRNDLIFLIAADYALMGMIDKMNHFAEMIDEDLLHQSKNPQVLMVWRELKLRSDELKKLQNISD